MIQVSKQTENFVECMKLMQDLYTKVYSSLEELYSEEATERIIADRFIEEFGALEKRVEELVIMSMKERMAQIGTSEI